MDHISANLELVDAKKIFGGTKSSRGGGQEAYKGPSTNDVRQMGRGVVFKFRTFPEGGWFVKVRTSENFSEQLLN